jgi:hypothetical protein
MCQIIFAQSPGDSVQFDKIASLKKIMSSGNRHQIVELIQYPLRRPYPLKSINSPQECLLRFDEVFDEAILAEIEKSNLNEDWDRVGWRGTIFKSGSLWLNDEYQIQSINHETKKSKALRALAIAKQKEKLPPSLRDFDQPELEWKTSKYVIRVDRKGDDYRLVVFDRKFRNKILRVLQNGAHQVEGQLGAFLIDWQSQGKTFRVYSGAAVDEDCYYKYDSLVGQDDWPDHPIEEQKRQN